MTRLCYDAVTTANCPGGAPFYLGYLDGQWPNADAMAALHPQARVVTVATNPAHPADMLDVENGDATPGQVPGWLTMCRATRAWPSAYCGLSNWTACKQACWSANVDEPPWFVAHYTGVAHIEPGAIATQYATNGYDTSLVADFWPGVDPAPLTDEYVEGLPMSIFLSDDDARNYAVRRWFIMELGGTPSVTEQATRAAQIAAVGVDLTYAAIRESTEAINYRRTGKPAAGRNG